MRNSKMPIVEYFEETDTLAILLRPGPGVGAHDIAENVVGTFDAQRRLIAIEFFGEVAKDYPELVAAADRPGPLPQLDEADSEPMRRTAESNESYRA